MPERAAFGDDPGATELQVEVFDVEAEGRPEILPSAADTYEVKARSVRKA
ncbi:MULTISPECIES: hypothetical protein [unclassified Nonomuraea]